jgi:hypothetical protein
VNSLRKPDQTLIFGLGTPKIQTSLNCLIELRHIQLGRLSRAAYGHDLGEVVAFPAFITSELRGSIQ